MSSILKKTLEHPLSCQYEYSTSTMSFTVTWSQRTVGGWGGDCLGGDLTDSPPALEA